MLSKILLSNYSKTNTIIKLYYSGGYMGLWGRKGVDVFDVFDVWDVFDVSNVLEILEIYNCLVGFEFLVS